MSRIETIGMKKHGSHAPSHSTVNYLLGFFSKLTAMFSMVHENINKKGERLVSSRNNKENLQIPTSSNLHINTVTNFDFTLTNYSIKILVF